MLAKAIELCIKRFVFRFSSCATSLVQSFADVVVEMNSAVLIVWILGARVKNV